MKNLISMIVFVFTFSVSYGQGCGDLTIDNTSGFIVDLTYYIGDPTVNCGTLDGFANLAATGAGASVVIPQSNPNPAFFWAGIRITRYDVNFFLTDDHPSQPFVPCVSPIGTISVIWDPGNCLVTIM